MRCGFCTVLVLALSACRDDAKGSGDDAEGSTTQPTTDTGSSGETGVPEPDVPGDDPWPDVARVPIPESFIEVGDGRYALDTGRELLDVGKLFYAEHADVYDVLIVWTEFDVADIFAFAIPLDHQIEGIGLQEVMQLYGWTDLSPASAGSDGALQHMTLMNSPATYENLGLYSAQDIVTHEVGHRWSANLSLPFAPERWVLTDAFYSHWNVYASVGGPSALGYGQLLDEGAGSFRFELVVPLAYSELELYQQGLIGPADVGELFYVTDAADYQPPDNGGQPWDSASYGAPVSYSGTRTDFTIADVITDHGPRIPSDLDAQREFRMAFVLVCVDVDACDQAALGWVDQERIAWETTFATATGDRATVDTSLE